MRRYGGGRALLATALLAVAAAWSGCSSGPEVLELPEFRRIGDPEARPEGVQVATRIHHVSRGIDRHAVEKRLIHGPASAGNRACHDAWRRAGARHPARVELALAFDQGRMPYAVVLIGASDYGLDPALERCLSSWLQSPRTWTGSAAKTGTARVEIQYWP